MTSTVAERVRARIASDPDLLGRLDALGPGPLRPESVLFGAQLRLVQDTAHFRTAVCSRRAGKTVGCAMALILAALARPESTNLYITRSRKNAKRIIWGTLKRLNRKHKLGGEPNESDLAITFANGSAIYLAGANDRDAIEDFRGNAMALAVVDEAQSMPAYLEDLVDSVLAPALMDYNGALMLIGTPAPVPVGYFYGCTRADTWSHHAWTVFDNPWIERKSGKAPQYHLDKELARRGIKPDDPVIQREWFGRWVYDPNSLVFRFVASMNTFDVLPEFHGAWDHVIGVDLGFDDADAISVLGWHSESPNCYQVDEWVGTKQTISALTERLTKLVDRYKPQAIVMDTGGLGKKIAEEIMMRTGLPIKAAEKTRKLEHIELVNDALRTGRLFVRPDSRFAQDALLVEWDRKKPEAPKISDRYHSDIADALLYGYMECFHWMHEAKPVAPPPGTPEWAREEARSMLQRELDEQERYRQEALWWQ